MHIHPRLEPFALGFHDLGEGGFDPGIPNAAPVRYNVVYRVGQPLPRLLPLGVETLSRLFADPAPAESREAAPVLWG
jgi:hypothetical protein